MRVVSRHGHFSFYPRYAGEIADFLNQYPDFELEAEEDYYTFPGLVGLKRYSLMAKPYGLLPAVVTYEGRNAWEVMRENEFVYNIRIGILVPLVSIVSIVSPPLVGNYYLSNGPQPFIQPGSYTTLGQKIISYEGEFKNFTGEFRISEMSDE